MKKIIFFLLASSFLAVACNSDRKDKSSEKKESMSSDNKEAMPSSACSKAEKNRKTALASIESFNLHDIDAMFKNVAADAVDYGDGNMAPVKNLDSIKAGVRAWIAAFPDVKAENITALSDGDGSSVMIAGQWTGTFKNDFMGMKATNKSFRYWDGDLFTFNEEGKIASHRFIQSSMTSMIQVGAKMPKAN